MHPARMPGCWRLRPTLIENLKSPIENPPVPTNFSLDPRHLSITFSRVFRLMLMVRQGSCTALRFIEEEKPMNIRILPVIWAALLACTTAAFSQPLDLLWGKPGGPYRHALAFSPGGTELAFAYVWGVRFADAASGQIQGAVSLRDPAAIAYSPGGTVIACAGTSGTVSLVDAESREILQTVPSYAERPQIAFVSDSLLLVRTRGPVRLWSLSERRFVRAFGRGGTGFALSPDRGRLAWVDSTGVVVAAVTGTAIDTIEGLVPEEFIFSADGASLLALHQDGPSFELRVHRLYDGAVIRSLPVGSSAVEKGELPLRPITLSQDGRLVNVTLGSDSSARFWDLASGRQEQILYFNTRVAAVQFSPDGRYLALGGKGLQAHQLDARTWNYIRDFDIGHTGYVWSVAYSTDDRWIATSGDDGRVRLWDARNGIPGRTLLGAESVVSDLKFSPDGIHLAGTQKGAGGRHPSILFWDIATGEITRRIALGPPRTDSIAGPGFFLAFTPDGGSVLTSDVGVPLRRWDVATGELTGVFGDSSGIIMGFALSADGGMAAAATADSHVLLWDLKSGMLLKTFPEPADPVSVAFSADGRSLVVGGSTGEIRVIDIASAASRFIKAFAEGPVTVAICRQRGLIFAIRGDDAIQVHDPRSGELLYRYGSSLPHAPGSSTGDVWSRMVVANDGSGVALAGSGGGIGAWRIDGVIAGATGMAPAGVDGLLQVWPNPVQGDIRIGFDLPAAGPVRLEMYNCLGEPVAVIAQSTLKSGEHEYQWDARGMAQGVYFIRLEADGISRTMPVVVRGR